MGRIEIDLGEPRRRGTRRAIASVTVFGIANFSHAGRGPHDFRAAGRRDPRRPWRAGRRILSGQRAPRRQAVSVHLAADRARGRRSHQAGARLARWISSGPALTIHVEMLPDHAFYFFGKEPGAGGLPTGTGGRLACLLSGGIDSPVAAYRMMRRGCSVLLIHFHSYPILSRASQEKVREIAALLTQSPAALAAGAGAVRRAAAAGAARRPARAARRHLPAADAAHCGAARAPVARAGARHRRGGRPGRVADPREPHDHRRGERRSRSCVRWSAWTRTRFRRRRSGSARCRSRTFPTRTAVSSSRRATRRRARGWTTFVRAEAALPIDDMVDRRAWPPRSIEDSRFRRAEHIG